MSANLSVVKAGNQRENQRNSAAKYQWLIEIIWPEASAYGSNGIAGAVSASSEKYRGVAWQWRNGVMASLAWRISVHQWRGGAQWPGARRTAGVTKAAEICRE